MKQCPECNELFDEQKAFCDMDGAALVDQTDTIRAALSQASAFTPLGHVGLNPGPGPGCARPAGPLRSLHRHLVPLRKLPRDYPAEQHHLRPLMRPENRSPHPDHQLPVSECGRLHRCVHPVSS